MLRKLLISILIIELAVVSTKKVQDLDDDYGDLYDKDMIESAKTYRASSIAPMPTTLPPTTTTTDKPQICTDLKPEYISTRRGGYQTLDCSAKICDTDDGINMGTNRRFVSPIFDWNSQFGHIYASNGTCDYERQHCWHSIDIDLEYLSKQMRENGVNEIQLSCSVSDYLSGNKEGDDVEWDEASDESTLKSFKGKGIDQSCDNDKQCGDNMFCLNSVRNGGTSCKCSVDFLTGVPYVRVMDQLYEEWICMPPILINDTCLYDQQCQAMDGNTVCGTKHTDMIDFGVGTCQCAQDMVYTESGCGPKAVEIPSKPQIIWWIFTKDDKESSSGHRFWWLRTASYMTAILAILLPITFIFIALAILCYRRFVRNGSKRQALVQTKFPSAAAPKIIISDFMRKEKSDDKYNLVKNDHLINQ